MNPKKPLISVIVPIYGIERYVGLCIESIINQSYSNLEIILVDDGGNDRCPEICDLYKSKDSRIKVIHKKNGGLVSARKEGVRQSNGEYISYVDGDDWIEKGFIENLYNETVKTDSDIVCAGYTRDLFSQSMSFYDALPAGVYEGDKIEFLWKNMISYGSFYRPGITTYVWNKLFKRNIIIPAQMSVDDRITIGEDGAVTYPALLNSSRIVLLENKEYHYRQREDSMLKQSASFAEEAKRLKYLYDYLKDWSRDKNYEVDEQTTDYILSTAIMRFGGDHPKDAYPVFDDCYYGKKVVVYSAGTFGQQLMNRFRETNPCNVIAWIDDDYWEYRRCCLNVDPVESVKDRDFDYIIIAKVDPNDVRMIKERLFQRGISSEKILSISIPKEILKREELLKRLVNIEYSGSESGSLEREKTVSHA